MSGHINALSQGTQLHSRAEKYEIVSVLGFGSFGITYHAKVEIMHGHIPVYGDVAIKEFFMPSICMRKDDGTVTVNAIQKKTFLQCKDDFRKEAEALQQLTGNEGVVKVNETFEANGTCYYVMEHLGNTTLKDLVATEGTRDEEEALRLFAQMTAAVGSLHAQNRLHLDIKPGNIMMSNGRPKLIDFGQSAILGGANHQRRTRTACSEGYAPPERYEDTGRLLPQTDIYSLGAVLCFMLTGKRPPAAGKLTQELLDEIMEGNASPETEEIVKKCMRHEAKDRYSCTGEILRQMHAELPEAVDEEEDGTTLLQDRPRPYRQYRRKALAIAAGTILTLAVAAGGTALTRQCGSGTIDTKQTVTTADTIADKTIKEPTPVETSKAEQPVEKAQKKEMRPKETPTTEERREPKRESRNGSNDLGWATWQGSTDDYGQPTGTGTLTVKRTKRLSDNITVHPGDRIVDCEFYQNKVYQGMLYRSGETTGEYINI